MAAEIKYTSIDNLYPYPENPRIDPVENADEAIKALFAGREEKMLALASHIVEHGLNPSEIMIVVEEHQATIVYEGNRRLTALKAIKEPRVISWDTSLSAKFEIMSQKADEHIFTVPYISLPQGEAFKWMGVRHLGEQSGIGISSWGHVESQRFIDLMGQPKTLGMQIWEFYLNNNGDPSLQPNSFTTFSRLVASKPGQKFLNIKYSDKKFALLPGIDDVGLVDRIQMLLAKMIEKKATSRTLNKVELIQEFIDSIEAEPIFTPPVQIPLVGSNKPSDSTADTTALGNQSTHSRSSEYQENIQRQNPRDSLFGRHELPRSFKPQMPRSIQKDALVLNRCYSDDELRSLGLKGCNILHDLQALDIMCHPYSAAATARMLLEYVIKIWAQEIGFKYEEKSFSLNTFVNNFRQRLISDKILNSHEQSIMKNLESQIITINGYIHTPNINIQHQQLRDFWAGVSCVVEKYIAVHERSNSGQVQ